MITPLIFEIKGNSLDDGPGIRSVIFFKGCPLKCVWCHNPEGMHPRVELAFDARECIGCNTCIETCPEGALARDNQGFIDRGRCTLCMRCTEACPSGALHGIGRALGVTDILTTVLKDKPFFDTSGGGVTFSGGEPTLYMDFLAELLQALKGKGIHCLLETCGQFDLSRFMHLVYPFLDVIYFDLKLFDAEAHRQFCGISNQTIRENFIALNSSMRADGRELLPRIPLVPGITDTDANLEAIADFLKSQNVSHAKLLPYNPLWPEKSAKIGSSTGWLDKTMRQWMPAARLTQCTAIFESRGIMT